eukprot:g419.t1
MSRESKTKESTEPTPWSENKLIVEPGKTPTFKYSADDERTFEQFESWVDANDVVLDFQKYIARTSMEFCARMGDGVQE